MPSARKTIFVLSLAIVFSIGANADTFSIQINDTGAFATVTPDGSVTQAKSAFTAGAPFVDIHPTAAWFAAGSPEAGIINQGQSAGTPFNIPDPQDPGYQIEYNEYVIAFTAPGSDAIIGNIDIIVRVVERTGQFDWEFAAQTGAASFYNFFPGAFTCESLANGAMTNTGLAGECLPYADGQVRDFGLFTGVDDLQVEIDAPASATPEPAGLVLLASGLSGLGFWRRKKNV